MTRRHWIWTIVGCLAVLTTVCGWVLTPPAPTAGQTVIPQTMIEPVQLQSQAPNWTFESVMAAAEPISAIAIDPDSDVVYAGTEMSGKIYRGKADVMNWLCVAGNLGEIPEKGMSTISALRLVRLSGRPDLDLVAITSQVVPRSQPRVYLWTTATPHFQPLASVALPITSSWSHGGGVVQGKYPALLTAHCGYGEVMQMKYAEAIDDEGNESTSLAVRQVAQLPASGEGLVVSDILNTGKPAIMIGTGFKERAASIRIYHDSEPADQPPDLSPARLADLDSIRVAGHNWKLNVLIDEEQRFGNVRFMTPDLDHDGKRELVAFWMTGIDQGDAEIIAYRLSQTGEIVDRQVLAVGPSKDLWPIDNRYTADPMPNVPAGFIFFATMNGGLWRLDALRNVPPRLIAAFVEPIGALAADRKLGLWVAVGNRLVIGKRSPATDDRNRELH